MTLQELYASVDSDHLLRVLGEMVYQAEEGEDNG